MNTQKLEQVPIDKLVPYARNARTHSKEQIAQLRASLREFGFVSPAVIDADYNILVGHGRIEAARAEGYETVPCVFAENLTEAQKRAYILADNQLALNAGWDEEMLSVELSDLQDSAFDLSLLGFGADELEKLLDGGADKDVKDDDFDLTAALKKASFVERGDIWTVGKHRLMCGDATSADDVNLLMDGKSANLILTDPPYGVSFKASDGLTIENDSLKGEEFYNFLLAAFKNMTDHLEKGGAAYCFHADTEGLTFRKAFIDAGFHLKRVVRVRVEREAAHEVDDGEVSEGGPEDLVAPAGTAKGIVRGPQDPGALVEIFLELPARPGVVAERHTVRAGGEDRLRLRRRDADDVGVFAVDDREGHIVHFFQGRQPAGEKIEAGLAADVADGENVDSHFRLPFGRYKLPKFQ